MELGSSVFQDTTILFASDTPRPPPRSFQNILLQVALNDPRRREIWEALALATEKAQVFDFGHIHDNKLIEEATRATPLYAADHLRLPFQSVVYWYDVTLDPERARYAPTTPQRYATLAIDASNLGLAGTQKRMLIACDWIDVGSDPALDESISARYTTRPRAVFMLAVAGYFQVLPGKDTWRGNLLHPNCPDVEVQTQALGGLGDGVLGLSMILATRGIPSRMEEPNLKLNAKRERNGKEPLTRVTHVDTKTYYEALKNSAKPGTHASPVPHLRRGHIRHLKDGRVFRDGNTEKWIPDTVVNCRSWDEAMTRSHYEVEA